jgi:hypothetical protein
VRSPCKLLVGHAWAATLSPLHALLGPSWACLCGLQVYVWCCQSCDRHTLLCVVYPHVCTCPGSWHSSGCQVHTWREGFAGLLPCPLGLGSRRCPGQVTQPVCAARCKGDGWRWWMSQ